MLRTFGPVLAIFAASCLFNLASAKAQPNWIPDYEVGWRFYRGHFYKLVTPSVTVSPDAAQLICEDLSAALAKPLDQEEFDFVASLAKDIVPNDFHECPVLGYKKTDTGFIDKILPWCKDEPSHPTKKCGVLVYNYRHGEIDGPCVGVMRCDSPWQKHFICKSV